MRSFIIITVLSALVACYGAAVLPSEEEMVTIIYDDKSPNGIIMSRADFSARSQGWVLLSEANDLIPAVEGQEQSIRMVYRAQRGVKINMLSVSARLSGIPEVNNTPLGRNYIDVKVTSRPGLGLNSTISVYRWD
ncbi:uncharacterized protein LOC111350975 [Spodoptera litura]|uniref:Uncharacterized protein LOC111350975 n=1 Tax=Spodoptera litura TaxID=69820 RepID=A0A9J7DXK7_SPOLT|nr:uncharacterized protein LOC111350975 [Spodoptera litura]